MSAPPRSRIGAPGAAELRTAPWQAAVAALPDAGRCVAAQFDEEGVWVYRTRTPSGRSLDLWVDWCDFVAHRGLEPDSGAEGAGALKLRRSAFDDLLRQAVDTTYDPSRFPMRQAWRLAVRFAQVTVSWGPAHDPDGALLSRCTPRLCVRGDLPRRLQDDWAVEELDVDVLLEDAAQVPVEQPYPIVDAALRQRLLGGAP